VLALADLEKFVWFRALLNRFLPLSGNPAFRLAIGTDPQNSSKTSQPASCFARSRGPTVNYVRGTPNLCAPLYVDFPLSPPPFVRQEHQKNANFSEWNVRCSTDHGGVRRAAGGALIFSRVTVLLLLPVLGPITCTACINNTESIQAPPDFIFYEYYSYKKDSLQRVLLLLSFWSRRGVERISGVRLSSVIVDPIRVSFRSVPFRSVTKGPSRLRSFYHVSSSNVG
jgi:hypothetical protein